MKFLCVDCDSRMTMETARLQESESVSFVFRCDVCGRKVAMLTNAMETQLVESLGMKPASEQQQEQDESVDGGAEGIRWTPGASERLSRIPEHVRPLVRQGIEKYAIEQNAPVVDEELMARVRKLFGF